MISAWKLNWFDMIIAIVGHGSIGSKYTEELLKRGYSIESFIIIESNISVLKKLRKEGFTCFESIKSIGKSPKRIEYAIIANWGPDHINSANQLLSIIKNYETDEFYKAELDYLSKISQEFISK